MSGESGILSAIKPGKAFVDLSFIDINVIVDFYQVNSPNFHFWYYLRLEIAFALACPFLNLSTPFYFRHPSWTSCFVLVNCCSWFSIPIQTISCGRVQFGLHICHKAHKSASRTNEPIWFADQSLATSELIVSCIWQFLWHYSFVVFRLVIIFTKQDELSELTLLGQVQLQVNMNFCLIPCIFPNFFI